MGLMVSEKKIFKVFPIISLLEIYMGMASILIYWPWPFVPILPPSPAPSHTRFNTRLHMKFEEFFLYI